MKLVCIITLIIISIYVAIIVFRLIGIIGDIFDIERTMKRNPNNNG
jgi:uncharacterized protein YneF (UPF0154 family)